MTKRLSLFIFIIISCFAVNTFAKPTAHSIINEHNSTSECWNPSGLTKSIEEIKNSSDYTDSIISDKGLFKIFWINQGSDAPPKTDINSNNTPDFIDSVAYYLDYAYEMQIDSLGFTSPIIFDPESADPDTLVYKVYVKDLKSTYGRVSNTAVINGRKTTAMELDNDFQSPSMMSKGYNGIKVTTMHEFHHSVQAISDLDGQSRKFSESSATYMEYRFFPEIKDYLQYISGNHYPNNSYLVLPTPLSGFPFLSYDIYGYANFFHMLFEIYGDQVYLQYFATIADQTLEDWIPENSDLQAWNKVLLSVGSSLESEFIRYGNWVYNAVSDYDGPGFKDVDLYPDMAFIEKKANLIEFDNGFENYKMMPYALKYTRFVIEAVGNITNDTIDILHYNLNYDQAVRKESPIVTEHDISFSKTPFSGSYPILEGRYHIEISNTSIYDSIVVIDRLGKETLALGYAYPSPFRLNTHSSLFLPVDDKMELYTEHTVEILDASLNRIHTFQGLVEPQNKGTLTAVRTIEFKDINSLNLRPGVYIYRIIISDDDFLVGKFAIVG